MLDDVGLSLLNLLKIFVQHRATLLNATCWPRLNIMLDNVERCWMMLDSVGRCWLEFKPV